MAYLDWTGLFKDGKRDIRYGVVKMRAKLNYVHFQ